MLYAFVWTNPKPWLRLFGQRAVQAFAACGFVGKVLQFSTCLLWAWAMQPTGLCLRQPLTPAQLLVGGFLVAYGQALNLGVYRALGTRGVYYGCRLGHSVPWVSGWPFSAVRHPQYTGSVLSVWGVLLLLWGALPAAMATGVAVFWTGLYVLSGLVENYL
ncbi:hypothetical protein TSOC_011728 [Tetrabaena socialis]|uniref:phosphatidyl-N-methylethanolamine N-methyltransferase n=1 Tax=Tetrabaena socialis TaxID=47790 RepID=A0A2J7ZPV7_9CHLO|nr:hypothetical protein TSOC_011728 [Tetrabaena socialis]|eukprot:PNH02299.1 hypothetical protein TSOC_011728 [Tetrabaena socialis]